MTEDTVAIEAAPATTSSERESRSFLMADYGSGNVKVTLFDRVDGAYRLVARGSAQNTAGPPYFDARRGLQQAVGQIVQATGRLLIDRRGQVIRPAQADGSGVDFFGLVVSGAEPLRVITVGLLDEVSVVSLRRAVQTVYAREVDCFSLSDRRPLRLQLESLLSQRPDLILLGGGTDGGADRRLMQLIDWLALALGLQELPERPVVVYAGNRQLRAHVQQRLGDLVDLRLSANVRPLYGKEQLGEAIALLGQIYVQSKARSMPGGADLLDWSSGRALPAAHALAAICEYMAADLGGRVLGLDLGSHTASTADAGEGAVRLFIDVQAGMGQPVETPGHALADLGDWFYKEPGLKDQDVQDYLHDHALHPHAVPLTETDLAYERAVARQVLRRVGGQVKTGRPLRRLLLRGQAFAVPGQAGELLLATLDALQPSGTFDVWADRLDVLSALGLLAAHSPRTVVEVLGSGAVTQVAWVVAPVSSAREGDEILKLTATVAEGRPQQVSVTQGGLARLSFPIGSLVEVDLVPAAGCDLGFGPGQGRKMSFRSGPLGLIVDGRGRPLARSHDPETVRELREIWQREMAA